MIGRRARSIESILLILIVWASARAASRLWPEAYSHLPAARSTGVAIAANSAPPVAGSAAKGLRMSTVLYQAQPRSPRRRDRGHAAGAGYAVRAMSHTPTEHLTERSDGQSDADATMNLQPPLPAAFDSVRNDARPSASFWILWRPDNVGVALGAGGQLGGSQAGGRILVPIRSESPVRLSLRMSTSFGSTRSRELAPGVSLKPMPSVPVEFVVERRLRAGSSSHDVMSAFAAGGVSNRPLADRWTLDAYVQAGVAGTRHPLWFADGAATVRKPITEGLHVGAGVWGGIQPGLKRLDIGPTISTRIAPDDLSLRLNVDWRHRIAGGVRPGSGIAVTVAKDF